MRITAAAIAATTILAAPAALADDAPKVTHVWAGALLAEPGKGVQRERTVVIEGERIKAILPGFVDPPEGARGVDLRERFVLPGLIDSHVHILNERTPTSNLAPLYNSTVDSAFEGARHAYTTLMAGFTTVQDVGGNNEAVFGLRDAIAAGNVPGPRMRASGRAISATGGHGDANGFAPRILELFSGPNACNGAEDCRRAVREAVKQGADVIKITATGGVLSNTRAGLGQQLFDDELRAIVEAAESMGRKVTAHAHGVDGINAALRAGVHSIEHGTYLDATSIRLFRETGATLVPTVLAGVTVTRWVDEPWLPAPSRAKAAEVGPRMIDMLRKAREGGVKVAFGTDSGVSKHGTNAEELVLRVEAGYTPEQAIRAATLGAAEHIEMAGDVGVIAPGAYADLIAVDGDPLADIAQLQDVDFVMKGGKVYKSE